MEYDNTEFVAGLHVPVYAPLDVHAEEVIEHVWVRLRGIFRQKVEQESDGCVLRNLT